MFVARLPGGAIGLLIVLQARHLGLSYAAGGLGVAGVSVGMAAGAPLLGRLADRHGQPLVLHLSGATAALALVAIGHVSGPHRELLLLSLSVLQGLVLPPVSACARAIWTSALSREPLNAVLALDASLQEISWMIGPLALTSMAVTAGPPIALEATALLTWIATACFALIPEARATIHGRRTGRVGRTGALHAAGVRLLVAVAVALGAGFGATELGVVASAGKAHDVGATGLLFGAWSAGSFVAGLIAAQRPQASDPPRRMQLLLFGLAGTTALLAAMPTLWALAAGLVLAGVTVAPMFAIAYASIGAVAPAGTLTEAYAWETGGLMVGIALGSTVAGAIGRPAGMFVFAAAAVMVGTLIVWRRIADLRPRPDGVLPVEVASAQG